MGGRGERGGRGGKAVREGGALQSLARFPLSLALISLVKTLVKALTTALIKAILKISLGRVPLSRFLFCCCLWAKYGLAHYQRSGLAHYQKEWLGALPKEWLGALPKEWLGALPKERLGALPKERLGALQFITRKSKEACSEGGRESTPLAFFFRAQLLAVQLAAVGVDGAEGVLHPRRQVHLPV